MRQSSGMPQPESRRIGFVGLGNMGRPMVALLAGSGHRVTAYDADRAAVEAVAQAVPIAVAHDLPALGAASEIVVTMLPTGDIVARVADALAGTMARGGVIVDMGSSAPLGTIALGERLAALGIGLVDAPVSGGVRRAVTGDLAIMVGGPAELIEGVRPVLELLGTLFPVGRLGSAHALKALNNFVSAAGLEAACEALLVAQRFGIDQDLVVEVLNSSTGRNNATENKLRQFVLNGSFGAGFAADLMAKDLRIAAGLADTLGVAAPMMTASARLWTEAAQSLAPGSDHTAMYRHLAGLAGAQP
jgi:3-hydroxyisobutyrate dehydrogenase